MATSDTSESQLQAFLQQLATSPRSSSSSSKCRSTFDGNNQQLIDQAESVIDVLLKVPWFLDLALSGTRHITITADGNICCGGSSGDLPQPPPPPQQQQHKEAKQNVQILLATTIAKLAAQQQQQLCGDQSDQTVLLQVLPQLLSCKASSSRGALQQQYPGAAILAAAAAVQLAPVQGYSQGADLAHLCIQSLISLTGYHHQPGPGSRFAGSQAAAAAADLGSSSSSRGLTLGVAASLDILGKLLEVEKHIDSTGSAASSSSSRSGTAPCPRLSHNEIGDLLQWVIWVMGLTGSDLRSDLRSEVQSVLLTPLMTAAAAAASPGSQDTYLIACQQLLLAACGSSNSTGAAAAAAAGSSMSSRQVSDGLVLACRLQPHMLVAVPQTGVCSVSFGHLLLSGLCHKDLHTRNRAVHLLTEAIQAGTPPKVSAFASIQWSSFISIYRSQEERVLHLIEPVWRDNYPVIWNNIASSSTGSSNSSTSGSSGDYDLGQFVSWSSVLLERAVFHTHVTMRRIGLAALFQIQPNILAHSIQHNGWQQLQQLLLTVLQAFENDKLVSDVAAGSAVARQAAAVAALQQQLTKFLAHCFIALQQQQQQQPGSPQQQQQQQQQQPPLITNLILKFVARVVEVADRAATAKVLLQALAAAAVTAASSSSSGLLCDLGSESLISNIGQLLSHIGYLHPAHVRPELRSAVMQLVPVCCNASSCSVDAALTILAALDLSSAAAAGSSAAGAAAAADCRRLFVKWLDSVICDKCTPAAAAATAAGVMKDSKEVETIKLQIWLQPLISCCSSSGSSRGNGVGLPQQKLLYSLGALALELSDQCQDVLTAAAAAAASKGSSNSSNSVACNTAVVSLACGIVTSLTRYTATLSTVHAAASTDSSSSSTQGIRKDTIAYVSSDDSSSGSSGSNLIQALQQLLLALLQHHNQQHQAGNLLDLDWLNNIQQLIHNLQSLRSLIAEKHHKQQQQQQQQWELVDLIQGLCTAVHIEISRWQQQCVSDIAAAGSSTTLDRQLMHLITAQIAAWALRSDLDLDLDRNRYQDLHLNQDQHQHLNEDQDQDGDLDRTLSGSTDHSSSSSSKAPAVPAAQIQQCIQQLCAFQPAAAASQQWQQQCTAASSSSSKGELVGQVLELRTALLAQLVAAADGGSLSAKTRMLVFSRVLHELEYNADSQSTLAQLLQLILAIDPYGQLVAPQHDHHHHHQQQQQQQQQEKKHLTTGFDEQQQQQQQQSHDPAVTDRLLQLLQVYQPLVRDSRKMTGHTAQLLVTVFFHPALFQVSNLKAMLHNTLIPFTFNHGGVRPAVALMTHICTHLLQITTREDYMGSKGSKAYSNPGFKQCQQAGLASSSHDTVSPMVCKDGLTLDPDKSTLDEESDWCISTARPKFSNKSVKSDPQNFTHQQQQQQLPGLTLDGPDHCVSTTCTGYSTKSDASDPQNSTNQQQQQQPDEPPPGSTLNSSDRSQRYSLNCPLDEYLSHVVHMCAFSVWADNVDQATILHHQRRDVCVVLPVRVVLCGHLLTIARSGSNPTFILRVILSLLDIAAGCGVYSWLSNREGSQSSGGNAIKVAVWQTLCLLAPYVPQDHSADEVIAKGWLCLLQSHHHSNVRPHVQLFMLALLTTRPHQVKRYLIPALQNYATSSYQVTVSVIVIVLFLMLGRGPRDGDSQFMTLLQALLPWSMHHRHAVRVPVQVVLHFIFKRHMTDIQRKLGPQAMDLLTQVSKFLSDNDETVKLRERQALIDVGGFDLDFETSLEGVFGVKESALEQLGDGESDSTGLQWHVHVRDRLPIDILSALPGAVTAVGNSFVKEQRQQTAAAAARKTAGDEQEDDSGDTGGGTETCSPATAAAAGSAVLYQFRPQMQSSLFDDSSVDRVESLVAGRACTPGLVVCASLLDNLPNLAGLCRTCESLSVEALTISNRSLAFTDAFKRQSVTSERWIQMLEVGTTDVGAFLRERKSLGYTVIGVEQASNSVPLQAYRFPKCCVLLIGNEQYGIPVHLLALLDVCVEIPMLGVTRSLNAHVSGAMVVWQYTQQHLPAQ